MQNQEILGSGSETSNKVASVCSVSLKQITFCWNTAGWWWWWCEEKKGEKTENRNGEKAQNEGIPIIHVCVGFNHNTNLILTFVAHRNLVEKFPNSLCSLQWQLADKDKTKKPPEWLITSRPERKREKLLFAATWWRKGEFTNTVLEEGFLNWSPFLYSRI